MKKSRPYLSPDNSAIIFSCLAPRKIYHYPLQAVQQATELSKRSLETEHHKQEVTPVALPLVQQPVKTPPDSSILSTGQREALCLLLLSGRRT